MADLVSFAKCTEFLSYQVLKKRAIEDHEVSMEMEATGRMITDLAERSSVKE